MRAIRGEPTSDYFAPLAVYLLVLIALAGAVVIGGIWFFQPTVVPNHGMAAYKPPAGTYLIPPPHKMDAPELAELPAVAAEPDPPDPIAKVAEQNPAAAKPKVAHKRAKPRPPRADPSRDYADGRWGNAWGGGGWGWGGGWTNHW